jgi:toxin-antitoxin system PIN domain toxin
MKYLLDVNVLIAAIWTTHADHAKADAWIHHKELATCPFSEAGFLRISTHPKALQSDMATARKLLADFIGKHSVEFVPADLPVMQSGATRSEEVTDFYLAELASKKNVRLATLDSQINHKAIELIS